MKDTLDPGTIDLFGGKAERDKGMKQAADNDQLWMQVALHNIQSLPPGWEGSGQDIRLIITNDQGPPHHPNVWGALTNTAIGMGLLVHTGHYKYTRLRASHKRRIPVYRRCA
jgi:hypothetical protein